MGSQQRRERERQAIRQSILSAARQIAIEEGWQAVTTRKVADRIEYSQPTIYEYFDNKEAILMALVYQRFESMLAAMQTARAQHEQPEEQLLAMTRLWVLRLSLSRTLSSHVRFRRGQLYACPNTCGSTCHLCPAARHATVLDAAQAGGPRGAGCRHRCPLGSCT